MLSRVIWTIAFKEAIDQLNMENQQISTLMIDQVEIIASDHSFAHVILFVRKIA